MLELTAITSVSQPQQSVNIATMLGHVRGRDGVRQSPLPALKSITVILLFVLFAYCSWYSRQSISFKDKDNHDEVPTQPQDLQLQLLASQSTQTNDVALIPAKAKLDMIPPFEPSTLNASKATDVRLENPPAFSRQSVDTLNDQIKSVSISKNLSSGSPSSPPSVEQLWAPLQSLSELHAFECVAWRQTTHCSPRGNLRPEKDASCDRIILPSDSGFCEYRHRTTGALRRIISAKCKSRASQMGYSCANATMLVRYNLMAAEYRPDYPLSFEHNQRDFLHENGLLLDNARQRDGLYGPQSAFFTQGIAYVVYDQLILSVYASIRVLRSHNCTLPIELWYRKDETDISHPLLRHLRREDGVYLRAIPDPRAKKFYTKLYAVFYSAFDHVLLLDADNFAAQDPTPLFSTHDFLTTGALFWPDFWMPNRTIFHTKRHSDVWEFLGVPFVDMFEQESGQVLVNRRVHTKALHALLHYGLTEPHFPARFNMLWGDKDLFRFAWMRTNSSFAMIERPPGSAGLKAPHLNIFCGTTMVQHGPDGDIVFLHRNIVKFLPGTDHTQKLWQYIQQYHPKQDLRQYEVRGDVDHRWFPTIRKCYGRRINYLRANSLKPIEAFPFARLEDEIIRYVLEGEEMLASKA